MFRIQLLGSTLVSAVLLVGCSGPGIPQPPNPTPSPTVPTVLPGNYWMLPTYNNVGCGSPRGANDAKVGFLSVSQDGDGSVGGLLRLVAEGGLEFDETYDVILVPDLSTGTPVAFRGVIGDGSKDIGTATMYRDGVDDRRQEVLSFSIVLTDHPSCFGNWTYITAFVTMPVVEGHAPEDVALEISGTVSGWPAGHVGFITPRAGQCNGAGCQGYFPDARGRIGSDGSYTLQLPVPSTLDSLNVCGASFTGLRVSGFELLDSETGAFQTQYAANAQSELLILDYSSSALSSASTNCTADYQVGWNALSLDLGSNKKQSIPEGQIVDYTISSTL